MKKQQAICDYTEQCISRLTEGKECNVMKEILTHVVVYKEIIDDLLKEKDVDNIIKSYKKYKDE